MIDFQEIDVLDGWGWEGHSACHIERVFSRQSGRKVRQERVWSRAASPPQWPSLGHASLPPPTPSNLSLSGFTYRRCEVSRRERLAQRR